MRSKKKSLKVGVVFFHKNIRSIYKERWVRKSVESILNQTYSDLHLYEINYGGDQYSILEGLENTKPHFFVSEEMKNHAEAMNLIIDKAFSDGCDFVFNTNLDDYFDPKRIEIQLEKLKEGYDIVSSDFCYIEEDEKGEDIVTFYKNIKSKTDIKKNLDFGHNVIAHPCVGYSKNFWENNKYVPDEIPREDLLLWKRAIDNGFKFYIMDDVLLFYRLHSNQITGDNRFQVKPTPPPNRTNPSGPTERSLKDTVFYD